jgi:hypothetical protein
VFHKLLNNNLLKDSVSGIEIIIGDNKSLAISYVIVKKNKNKFHVIKTGIEHDSFEAVANEIKKTPSLLSIDGKGILHKIIPIEENTNPLEKILPNASEIDFYIQQYISSDTTNLISISRKDLIDEIILKAQSAGLLISGICLGPINVDSLGQEEVTILTKTQKVEIKKGKIQNIEKSVQEKLSTYTFEHIDITVDFIVAFSNAVSQFKTDFNTSFRLQINNLSEEFYYSRLFKLFSLFILTFILILLLVNFFIFSDLNNKNETFSTELGYSSEYTKKIENLSYEIKTKRELIEKSGIQRGSTISFYFDNIISEIPSGIKLRTFNYHPVVRKIKPGEEIEYSLNEITLTGVTKASVNIDKWIENIKSINWVKQVELNNYSQEDTNAPAEFEIIIIHK